MILGSIGCYRPAPPTPPFRAILPTYGHEIGYKRRLPRRHLPALQAQQWTRDWFAGHKPYLSFEAQKPIRKKTDLVYIGYIPAFPLPDSALNRSFPSLRYWITLDNQPDSSFVWITNVEVFTHRQWEPLVNQPLTDYEPDQIKPWLQMLDGLFTSVLDELTELLQQTK